MSYNVDDLEKILSYKSWSDKKKFNTLLEIDADIYCNLGSESTKTDILNAKKNLNYNPKVGFENGIIKLLI